MITIMETRKAMIRFFQTVWDNWILGGFTALGVYFAPTKEVFYVLTFALCLDFFFGIWASRMVNRPITSRKLRGTVSKSLGYLSILLLTYSIETVIGVDWIATFKIISGFILFVEALSVIENIAIATQNEVFIKLLKFLRGKARQKHGSLIDDLFEEKHNR